MERNRSEMEKSEGGRKSVRHQQSVTDALVRTFFAEWAETGFATMSLERVAKRAGVGKAALYRRWGSKTDMACDLLSRQELRFSHVEDTGSMESDVEAQLLSVRRLLRHPRIGRILADIYAEIGREPSLAEAIRPIQQARRARVLAIIERAIARDELGAAIDRETVADLMIAPLYWRLAVTGGRSDRTYIARLARMITSAAKAAS